MKIVMLSWLLACSFFIGKVSVDAMPLDVPITKSSDHWSVTIDKEQYDGPKDPSKYRTYSFMVKNIGKDATDVNVKVYRDEPNGTTMAALFEPNDRKRSSINNGDSIIQQNFSVANDAKEIEVLIFWKDNRREYKESFSIKSK